jgi:choline-sulfatase
MAACGKGRAPEPRSDQSPAARPAILLVTLDTTRADAIGPDVVGVETPAFNALAARGRRFRQAYAAVPETLPAHTSIMTGLYPGGHGVHENGRYLSTDHIVAAERLQKSGYHTAAFVSSFILARRFGLARGFDLYNDDLPAGRSERTARDTTDAALAQLAQQAAPFFIWVHYYDPHYPYDPPEPFRTRYVKAPYLGEVAAMDEQLGRLVQAFEQRAAQQGAPAAIAIVADHGEGLGEHGEAQHGNLLYQSTMHVPLVLVGPGVTPGVSDTPVSTRRIFHTLLDWAGLESSNSLRAAEPEVVLGEAMKPFLDYGWQPQVMTVAGRIKAILAGKIEAYDLSVDAAEARNLGSAADLPASVRKALDDYPVPAPDAARAPAALDDEARRRLASLGYVGASSAPVVRRGAPRPADMAPLFGVLDQASGLFVNQQYAKVIPLLERIFAADPYNLDAALRLATAHSSLGHDAQAERMFEKAREIAPASQDVKTYLALHYARGAQWERAVPLLEEVVAATPDRLPAVEALASIRERQGRIDEAIALRQRAYAARQPSAAELAQLGQLAMRVQQTPLAIESFEKARRLQGSAFRNDLELGVLYLAAGRFQDAKTALDRIPASNPEYPMVLFKRAQVSVLLHEPDQAARIDAARRHADATTRELIARERLFQR